MKKLNLAVLLIFLIILAGCSNLPCKQEGTKCCKGDSCSVTFPHCAPGSSAKMNGCNDKCIPNWECVKELEVSDAVVGKTNIGNKDFTFDLYSKLNLEEGNLFYSPYSISTALSMAYEGARGDTAKQMEDVFHFDTEDTPRRAYYALMSSLLNSEDAEYELSTANALWVEQTYRLLDEYTGTIFRYYDRKGESTQLNFAGDPELSRQVINEWVEDNTNNKIKDLLPKGSIMSSTRLVLTNAIYFKGTWLKQFEEKLTYKTNFYATPDSTFEVDMMQRTDKEAIFGYGETEDLQILEMFYEGEDLSMMVLLPKDNKIKNLETLLDSKHLLEWQNKIEQRRVNVFIPKFKFTTGYGLVETFQEMGMVDAFDGGLANFEGIDGSRSLSISGIFHQAFVEVNEEGTEAAAATGVVMTITSSMPPTHPTFRADHPFIFLIQHKETGAILFIGKVVDPR